MDTAEKRRILLGNLKVSRAMPLKNNVLFVQEAMSKKRKRYLTVFNLRACHDLLLRRATFHSSEAEDTIQK